VPPHCWGYSQRSQVQACFRLIRTRQLSPVEFGKEPQKARDRESSRRRQVSMGLAVVVETAARPCARAILRPEPFRTTTAQRAPRRRSLWPTKGKRSPPPPPSLAPVGWDKRATAAPGGSGARRDLQEIRSFAGSGCVMLSNTIRIRPRRSFSYPIHSQFSASRVCVPMSVETPFLPNMDSHAGFCREGRT